MEGRTGQCTVWYDGEMVGLSGRGKGRPAEGMLIKVFMVYDRIGAIGY